MKRNRITKYAFGGTLLAALLVPAAAFAADATTAAASGMSIKPIGAALAMGLSAIGAGWAQAKIGSAGQGTLAERPEERVFVLVLTALPEIIALLGFVMAILING